MKKLNKKNLIENFIIGLFILITFILMQKHELWRDEAQQWLLIKNLNLFDLFKQLAIEGHPCLWYLILKGYSILGLPYEGIGYISWLLSSIASILLVKKTNINIWLKIGYLFSINMMFYCSVIARSYSLILLEFVLLYIIYPKRKKQPILYSLLLISLLNTHILVFGLVLILLILELFDLFIKREKDNYWLRIIGSIIVFLGILLLFIQLKGAGENHLQEFFSSGLAKMFFKAINYLLDIFRKQICNNFLCNLAIACFIYFIIWVIIKKQYRQILILIISLGGQLGIYLIYGSVPSYTTCITFFIILFIYINLVNEITITGKTPMILVLIIFIGTIYSSIIYSYKEINFKYSDSLVMANYIDSNIDEKDNLYCLYPPICTSIIPYIKNDIIDVRDFQKFTYVNWQNEKKYPKLNNKMINKIKKDKGKYIIVSKVLEKQNRYIMDLQKNNKIKLLYQSSNSILSDDSYMLFEIVDE